MQRNSEECGEGGSRPTAYIVNIGRSLDSDWAGVSLMVDCGRSCWTKASVKKEISELRCTNPIKSIRQRALKCGELERQRPI
jgi:hypothetical protein